MRVLVGLLLAPPLVVVGVLTGVASLALHSRWWGLLLVVATVVATFAALPRRWWSRPAFVVGWAVPVLWVGLGRGPGGDVVVRADALGYALLVLVLVVAVATVLTLPRREPVTSGDSSARPSSA